MEIFNLRTCSTLFLVLTLGGCVANKEGIVIDKAVIEAHRDMVKAKSATAAQIANACIINSPNYEACNADSQCIAMMTMASALAASAQSTCVQQVAAKAASVAIQVPQIRARGFVGGMEALCGPAGCLANSAGLASTWLGIKAFSFGGKVSEDMRDVAIGAGRANINNSVNTSTSIADSYNVSEANGNTSTTVGDGSIVGSGQIGNNETTTVDNGSQIGDGIIAGGSVAGLGQCSGNQCQPVDSQNPIVNNEPDPVPAPLPVPGDADGICFTFSLVSDPDCP